MDLAKNYVSGLQSRTADEDYRRERRRQRRNDHLAGVDKLRQRDTRVALQRDILRRVDMSTVLEEKLFTVIRRTAKWWDVLCDHSIEHQLKCELAQKKQAAHLRRYLGNALERENCELENVWHSDAQRWELTKRQFEEEERQLREEAVRESMQSVQDSTNRCIQFLIDYCIEDSRSSILAQFALAEVMHGNKASGEPASSSGSNIPAATSTAPNPSVSAQGAFKAIFGGNPFIISSPTFLDLLHMMFRCCNAGRSLSTLFFDISPVPIFALDGPKFSGKSMLTQYLVDEFGFHWCSDRSLVEKALAAKEKRITELEQEQLANNLDNSNTSPTHMDRAPVADDEEEQTEGGEEQQKVAGDHSLIDFGVAGEQPSNNSGEAAHEDGTPSAGAGGAQLLASEMEAPDHSQNSMAELNETTAQEPQHEPLAVAVNKESDEHQQSYTDDSHTQLVPPPLQSALLEKPEEHKWSAEEVKNLNDEWADLGATIEEVLLSGRSIPNAHVADLFALQTREVKLTNCAGGIIFDGVITNAEGCEALEELLLPQNKDPYKDLLDKWCPTFSESAAVPVDEDGEIIVDVPIPEGLRKPAVVVEDGPARKEPRAKSLKRGAQDVATLPPPELPEVEDTTEEITREKQFVVRAQEQLEAYAGLFTALLYIECSPEEIFKRFAGLRLDKQTGDEYHMIYQPPPPDRVPYLVSLDRTTTYTAQLSDVVFRQDREWKQLTQWLRAHPSMVSHIREITGEDTVENMQRGAREIVIEAKNNFFAGKQLYESMRASQKRVEELEATRNKQLEEREAERLRLFALYTDRNAPIPPELEAPAKRCEFESDLPAGLPEIILQAVSSFTSTYISLYDWAWGCMSGVAKLLLQYRITSQKQLHKYWQSPDGKQVILDKYVNRYNETPAALRSKPACKDEMHAVVDDLTEALFSSVDTRRRECTSLIDTLTRREAFLEGWEANVCNIGLAMAQAEAGRFVTVVNILLFYFSALLEEPCIFEEIDIDVVAHTHIQQTTPDGNTNAADNRLGKRQQSAKKGHNPVKQAEETNERAMQDAFSELIQRITTPLTAFVDKFRAACDTNSKNQKKVVMPNTGRLVGLASHCLPIFDTELAKTVERLGKVRDYICELIHQGEAYREKIRREMHNEARNTLQAQAAAVNSALYILRSRIEEERLAPAMHLGYGTFSIISDPAQMTTSLKASPLSQRSFLTDVPLYQDLISRSIHVHATLCADRLMELISVFQCMAPSFQLPRDDFILVVREDDYAAAAAAPGKSLKNTQELFRSFDRAGSGVMDWREFIMHLLFWCSPPPLKGHADSYYIPEVTIEQLLKLKADLSAQELHTVEQFHTIDTFYDTHMSDDLCEVYSYALWQIFYDTKTSKFDTTAFLWFLCSDVQPIRGAQKALHVLSASGDAHVTKDEFERILHVHATNPRTLGQYDPFSKQNMHLLFGEAKSISFAKMRGCTLGRYMLNSVNVFHRKLFVDRSL